MKILGEKSTKIQSRAPRAPNCSNLGTRNLGTQRAFLWLLPTRYQVFRDRMSSVEDILGPIMVFMHCYRGVRVFYEHNCVT